MDELDLTSYTVDDLLALWGCAGSLTVETYAAPSSIQRAIGLEIGRRAAIAYGVRSPHGITALNVFFEDKFTRFSISTHMLKYARSLEEKRI